MVEPKNGKNPIVQQAQTIRLPMPGEIEGDDEDWEEYEDDDEYEDDHDDRLALPLLWNPNAAANWSLLLTPAFGALLPLLLYSSGGQRPPSSTIVLVLSW